MKGTALALTLAFTASLTAPALAQVDPARVVAVVNGREIKGAEYYRRMEYLPGLGKQMGENLVIFPPGFFTLEQLITEQLILDLAKERGVLPTDIEVANEISARTEKDPNYVKNWTASGQTEAELRRQVLLDRAQFKMTTQGVTVTDQEVDAHYKTYGDVEYSNPAKYNLRVIAVTSDAAKKVVDADLAAGQEFGAVAKARSEDPTAAVGGLLNEMPLNAFNNNVQAALKATKVNQNTAWLETNNGGRQGWFKLRVDGMTPAKKLPLDAPLRREIREKLMVGKSIGRNDIKKAMLEMRKKAKIDIKQKEFADAYKSFIQTYLRNEGAGG